LPRKAPRPRFLRSLDKPAAKLAPYRPQRADLAYIRQCEADWKRRIRNLDSVDPALRILLELLEHRAGFRTSNRALVQLWPDLLNEAADLLGYRSTRKVSALVRVLCGEAVNIGRRRYQIQEPELAIVDDSGAAPVLGIVHYEGGLTHPKEPSWSPAWRAEAMAAAEARSEIQNVQMSDPDRLDPGSSVPGSRITGSVSDCETTKIEASNSYQLSTTNQPERAEQSGDAPSDDGLDGEVDDSQPVTKPRKTPRRQAPRHRGDWIGTVTHEDLRSPDRIREIHRRGVDVGHLEDSDAELIRIIASATEVLELEKRGKSSNPCGLFADRLRSRSWREHEPSAELLRCARLILFGGEGFGAQQTDPIRDLEHELARARTREAQARDAGLTGEADIEALLVRQLEDDLARARDEAAEPSEASPVQPDVEDDSERCERLLDARAAVLEVLSASDDDEVDARCLARLDAIEAQLAELPSAIVHELDKARLQIVPVLTNSAVA